MPVGTAPDVNQTPSSGDRIDWARTRDILISIIAAGIILYAIGLILRNFLQTVLIFMVAALVAFALVPSVNGLTDRRVPRWLAVTIVYLGLLLAVLVGGYWIGGQLVAQLSGLATQVPAYTKDVESFAAQLQAELQRFGVRIDLQQQLNGATASLQAAVTGALSQSLKIVSGLTTAIISIVLVIFFSVYLVVDAPRIRTNLPRLVPKRYQRVVRFVQTTVQQKVGGFIRGQIIMAIIIGITTGAVAGLLGVHFPLVLGVLAFFFELIPTIGPVLIGLSLALVAVFQSFLLLIEVLVFYIVLNVIESNLLGPRIVGQAVGLPPFVSLIAIVAGAEVGGILGALFAVPATALVVTLAAAVIDEWKGRDTALSPAVSGDGATASSPPALDIAEELEEEEETAERR